MIGNKLELEIISVFNRDITQILSINQVAKELKKAYPYINSKVNNLIKEGVLNKVDAGRSYLCTINLSNEKAVALLILDETEKKDSQKTESSHKLYLELKNIQKEFKIYTILQVKKELYFVLDHLHDKEAIKSKSKELRKHQASFYTKQEFQKELLVNKSLLTEKTILYSAQKYYELVDEIKGELFTKYSSLFGKNG